LLAFVVKRLDRGRSRTLSTFPFLAASLSSLFDVKFVISFSSLVQVAAFLIHIMGPKKGQAPRSKKPQQAVPGSDHIVFTNKQTEHSKEGPEKDSQSATPRPDARKVIGGASWTGKLPMNLLSELCQKQKWNKPEYSMRKLPDAAGGGHVSTVTLSAIHPKTKETTKLAPFQLPHSQRDLASQETPLEARHFAATYALFRVSSMKNIHMTLPPKYRDLWKGEFARFKEEDVRAGRAWMYDADPFAAAIETKKIQDSIEVRRAKIAQEKATSSSESNLPGQSGGKALSKAWERAPRVDMGNRIRSEVEDVVKSHGTWNVYQVTLSEYQRHAIVMDLSNLGFRRSHVEEAVQKCKDREETLEWLLIHVPEDDLPAWSFPENYASGISLASGDLSRESKIKRLALAGYSSDDCASALRESDGDERAAAQELQNNLVGMNRDSLPHEIEVAVETWQEELGTLGAIFGDRFSSTSPDECSIQGDSITRASLTFHFRRPLGDYPQSSVPLVAIHSKDIPAYIRLSAVRRALNSAAESLMGGPMIYNLVEWLETNLPAILADPGPLSDISQHKIGRETHATIQIVTKGRIHPQQRTRQVSPQASTDMKAAHEARALAPAQQNMLRIRQTLPAWDMKGRIVEAVSSYQCVIISGETGSGKSTQSVQFILDQMIDTLRGSSANILCTQPRRISALGLADRVSDERCSTVGAEVGYIIRGDAKIGPSTRITFMTTGVLLRRMQSSEDVLQSIADVSHIFVDEVHERSVDTDFLLALLRDVMKVRPDLKVVLMSATLDANIFVSYFGGLDKVGHVHIPGRTYPVIDYYLDDIVKLTSASQLNPGTQNGYTNDVQTGIDELSIGRSIRELGMGINYNLLADIVSKIDFELGEDPGGILIFLPGTLEIDRCLAALRSIKNVHALPLHASLTPADQRRVFPSPPTGMRKVIASTNVAETSITIADIVAVIDTGRVKETNYDAANSIVRLEEVWASQAACQQRRGRAGRVRPGKCYKMFTRKVESEMAARPQPEIRRLPLEQLCLSVKATAPNRDVAYFLQHTLTPPEDQAIDVAMTLLHRMGALDNNELTALGRHLSMIPADLRCAKLLVYGVIFGCLEACLTITAILTVRSPFVSPRDKRNEAKAARSSFSTDHGDLLLDMKAFAEWSERSQSSSFRDVREWCSDKFLSAQTLRDVSSTRSQLLSSLKDASIISLGYGNLEEVTKTLNRDNNNFMLLRTLIAGALNPQIARIEFPDKKYFASMAGAVELDPEAKTIRYFNQDNGRVFVHPSSVLFEAQTFSGSGLYVSYFSKMATSKTFIRELTRMLQSFLPTVDKNILTDSSLQSVWSVALRRSNCSRHLWEWLVGRSVASASWMGTHRCSCFTLTSLIG
jgi:ATP-dependent RNA helicase DHX57